MSIKDLHGNINSGAKESGDNIVDGFDIGLGSLYALSYNFEPETGANIEAYYIGLGDVKLDGSIPRALKIGQMRFVCYIFEYESLEDGGRKTTRVKFVDPTFKLGNYYLVQPNTSCGDNVFPLGTDINEHIMPNGLSSYQQKLKREEWRKADLMKFYDQEYAFSEFIGVLSRVFTVESFAPNSSVKGSYYGSFRDVLNSWCSDLGLTYYFNGAKLIIKDGTVPPTLPDKPDKPLSYRVGNSLNGTFTKTVSDYIKDEGSEFKRTSKLITYLTLYPIETVSLVYKAFSTTEKYDIQQVAAAKFGYEFWMLYNYAKYVQGTLSPLGESALELLPIDGIATEEQKTKLVNWATAANQNASESYDFSVAKYNEFLSKKTFQYYSELAAVFGRFYVSNEIGSDVGYYENFTWKSYPQNEDIDLKFIRPPSNGYKSPAGTSSDSLDRLAQETENFFSQLEAQGTFAGSSAGSSGPFYVLPGSNGEVFPGFIIGGQRAVWEDTSDKISDDTVKDFLSKNGEEISSAANGLLNGVASSNDFEKLKDLFDTDGGRFYMAIEPPTSTRTKILDIVTQVADQMKPQFTSKSVKGEWDRTWTDWYEKYYTCRYLGSANNSLGLHVLDTRQLSNDAPMLVKSRTQRDIRYYENIFALMPYRVASRQTPIKTISFDVDYIYSTDDPIGKGMKNMSISFAEDGVKCGYTFSDQTSIPTNESTLRSLEREARNSTFRNFKPGHAVYVT